jgi:glycosyltransferase involved in cell wall biosynthesis
MSKPIKVAVGMKMQPGAYGGANQFGLALQQYLEQHGITVVYDLQSPDIDLILITDTRPWLKSCAFAGAAALSYVQQHPETRLLFRVNECDQKRGTTIKVLNTLIARHAALADHVVYISKWLCDLFENRYPSLGGKSSVIRNGGDTRIFNPQGYQPWTGQGPLRLVTHHWSSNRYKGLDVYAYLDQLLGAAYKDRVTFTFIGNPPQEAAFSNITVIPPLSGADLAKKIKEHHVYLTASLFEPAGMHHIEGALCGLPLLYRLSGALPEYCQSFGIPFTGPSDFADALTAMLKQYSSFVPRLASYDHTADQMCEEYYQLITALLQQPSRSTLRPSLTRLQLNSQALFAKETILNLVRHGLA